MRKSSREINSPQNVNAIVIKYAKRPNWRLNDTVLSLTKYFTWKLKDQLCPTLVDHGNESRGSRILTRYTIRTQKGGFKIAVISTFVVLLHTFIWLQYISTENISTTVCSDHRWSSLIRLIDIRRLKEKHIDLRCVGGHYWNKAFNESVIIPDNLDVHTFSF